MEPLLSITREQARRVDVIASEKYGLAGVVLMENAGRGVVDALLTIDPSLCDGNVQRDAPPVIAILCGQGNNAGDGFVIARHLAIRGVTATTVLLASPSGLTGGARTNYDVLARSGTRVVDLSAPMDAADLEQLLELHAGGAAWLVDALLGTGAAGAPRGSFRTAIAWANAQPARRLAVDVPSGLDCDSGVAADVTVRADVTCTFVAQKVGFLADGARPFLGEVRVTSIGTPACVLVEAVGAG